MSTGLLVIRSCGGLGKCHMILISLITGCQNMTSSDIAAAQRQEREDPGNEVDFQKRGQSREAEGKRSPSANLIGHIWLRSDIYMGYCVCGPSGVELHKQAKTRTRPIPSHLDQTNLSIKGLIYGKRTLFSCRTHLQRVIPNGQGSSVLPARVANHCKGFGSSCLLTGLAI